MKIAIAIFVVVTVLAAAVCAYVRVLALLAYVGGDMSDEKDEQLLFRDNVDAVEAEAADAAVDD